jgi:hypothetical protein
LPFEDLRLAFEVHNPDYIFTIVTSVPGPDEIQNYINRLAKNFLQTKVLMSGFQVVGQDVEAPANVFIFKKLQDFIGYIAEPALANG